MSRISEKFDERTRLLKTIAESFDGRDIASCCQFTKTTAITAANAKTSIEKGTRVKGDNVILSLMAPE